MDGVQVVEVLRRPGSPQLNAHRVRGSWRDYLDPLEAPEVAEGTDESSPHEFGGDFEPFSDTCGELEDDESDDDVDFQQLDLALFEPGRMRPGMCCSCSYGANENVMCAAGFICMLVEHSIKGKWYFQCLLEFLAEIMVLVPLHTIILLKHQITSFTQIWLIWSLLISRSGGFFGLSSQNECYSYPECYLILS